MFHCRHHDPAVAERVPVDCRRNGAFHVDGSSTSRSGHTAYSPVLEVSAGLFLYISLFIKNDSNQTNR